MTATADPPSRARRIGSRVDRAAGALAADLCLYLLSAVFAAVTAGTSTLLPHRAWGSVATVGYLIGAVVVTVQLLVRRTNAGSALAATRARAALTGLVWAATMVVPMVGQCVQRAAGRTDRAQDEVIVIEQGGQRLLDHGTPYLPHDAIAALPPGEQLLGYLPYQPGMALFGLPRAIAGVVWWADARIWFALASTATLLLAVAALRRSAGSGDSADRARRDAAILRAVQLSTVLPLCALTMATGGDDLPVLGLCLLALALCAARRPGAGGIAVGIAGALKLFAWPVAAVLVVHGLTRGRRPALRLAAGAIGLPVVALIPAQLVAPGALTENVLRFPLGHGLVRSPAESPFPGHLIAQGLPGGRLVAAGLLVAAGAAIAVRLIRRPPHTAAATATVSGYGLLGAILLMPSTRFGYLLYPVALLAWSPALRLVRPVAPAVPPSPVPVLSPDDPTDRPVAIPTPARSGAPPGTGDSPASGGRTVTPGRTPEA